MSIMTTTSTPTGATPITSLPTAISSTTMITATESMSAYVTTFLPTDSSTAAGQWNTWAYTSIAKPRGKAFPDSVCNSTKQIGHDSYGQGYLFDNATCAISGQGSLAFRKMNNCCFAGTHGASDDIWAYSGGSECGLMCFVDPEKYSFEEFEDCLHGTHANNATEADGGGVGMVSFCSEEYVALSKGEKPKKKVNGAVRLNMGLLKAWSVLAGIVGIGVVVGAL